MSGPAPRAMHSTHCTSRAPTNVITNLSAAALQCRIPASTVRISACLTSASAVMRMHPHAPHGWPPSRSPPLSPPFLFPLARERHCASAPCLSTLCLDARAAAGTPAAAPVLSTTATTPLMQPRPPFPQSSPSPPCTPARSSPPLAALLSLVQPSAPPWRLRWNPSASTVHLLGHATAASLTDAFFAPLSRPSRIPVSAARAL